MGGPPWRNKEFSWFWRPMATGLHLHDLRSRAEDHPTSLLCISGTTAVPMSKRRASRASGPGPNVSTLETSPRAFFAHIVKRGEVPLFRRSTFFNFRANCWTYSLPPYRVDYTAAAKCLDSCRSGAAVLAVPLDTFATGLRSFNLSASKNRTGLTKEAGADSPLLSSFEAGRC